MLWIGEPLVQIPQCTFHHSDKTGWDVAVDVMLGQEPPKQLNRLLGDRLHFLYGASTCNVPDRAAAESHGLSLGQPSSSWEEAG